MNEQPPESTTNTLDMTFNKIPAGTFLMGSPETEEGREDDEHQHQVTITKAFYMQTMTVTQSQWKSLMGTEPWHEDGENGPNYPITYVSRDDAVAFCEKLREKETKTYRLPTEAEWEYACRAGTETTWCFGNDGSKLGDYAWYRGNAGDTDENYAHQVGLKKPNPWGLYDMHGNVHEWCDDYWGEHYYLQSPEKDPTGPASADDGDDWRVVRGGCSDAVGGGDADDTHSASRWDRDSDDRADTVGFRVVRELD